METIVFNVTGMSCMGCVNSVRNLLAGVDGTGDTRIDLASGRVEVDYDPLRTQPDQLKQTIEDGGYGVLS